MGNPHAVVRVDSVDTAEVGILGSALTKHPAFPRGVNVGFLQIVDAASVRLRVYERGVGETLACGTGAAAAVAVGRRWGILGERVDVRLPGGVLIVRWPGPGAPLWQSGPTTMVYEGQFEVCIISSAWPPKALRSPRTPSPSICAATPIFSSAMPRCC
jgi:diaminopimelate epimerase